MFINRRRPGVQEEKGKLIPHHRGEERKEQNYRKQ